MSDLLIDKQGTAGVITLNRPHALNALSHPMVRHMLDALGRWQEDPAVRHVVIRSGGGRAFSAGGDIRDLYLRGRTHYDEMMGFFADEYRLDTRIREYGKPFIALIDGIVMGGGVGVSINGRFRVATQNIRFAMPEVGIGFFPDVGATYFLPRIADRVGRYCALTGARLDRDAAAAAGIVTHTVDAGELDRVFSALTRTGDAPAVLAEHCTPAATGPAMAGAATIARCFAADRVEDILACLQQAGAGGDEFAAATAAAMRTKSPTSLKIALRQMQFGETAPFRDCMRTEYRIVSHVLRGHDFYEGVRAAIIDKDNRPRWSPATLEQVADADIDAYFAASACGDLAFEP